MTPLDFILGVLNYSWELIAVQILNFEVLWTVVPVYICWFFTLFITKGKEYEDVANNFLNGFAVFWVALDVGKYLIEGFNEIPFALIKFTVVIGLIVYGVFIMRLAFQGRDIRRYIARVGEVSVVNIATILFIQDLIPPFTTGIELLQLVIGFIMLYGIMDLVIVLVIKKFWTKRGYVPSAEKKKEELPRIKKVLPEEEVIKPKKEEAVIEERPVEKEAIIEERPVEGGEGVLPPYEGEAAEEKPIEEEPSTKTKVEGLKEPENPYIPKKLMPSEKKTTKQSGEQ